jgi:hypothetical protein
MTPQELQTAYPQVSRWIGQTLSSHARKTQTVASVGFPRLPHYFSQKLLASTKFVPVERVPMPPLSAIGLSQFAEFEQGDFDAITYLNTFFVKSRQATDEQVHFHELIHIVQWRQLGPERFFAAYINGLETYGYCNNPLEVIACNAEAEFCRTTHPFDAEKLVEEEMERIDPPLIKIVQPD